MASAQSAIEAQLRSNSPEELQSHGIKHFADLNYRVEVARRMAQNSGTTHALLFDDVAFAVPEEQRPKLHALPGYERALLPALLLAPGFENGVSVLVSAPPNPVERQSVSFFHQALEKKLGRTIPYKILFESSDGMVDLTKLSDQEYARVCHQYAKQLNDPKNLLGYNQWHHLNTLNLRADEITSKGKTLVIPFQVTEHHRSTLAHLIDKDAIALPSIPNLDKATNNFLLREAGYTDIPVMLVITSQGEIMAESHQLQEYKKKQLPPVPATNENVTRFANAVLSAVDRLAQEGKKAYIKLDSNGVSGLGNLAHKIDDYTIIYDATRQRDERLKILVTAIFSNYRNYLPETAVVEEFIQARMFEGVKHDITVGGVMIGGTFFPMSSFPFGVNNNDEYVAGWMAEKAEAIGESESHWKLLFNLFARMGKTMATVGYTDGVLAGDVLTDFDGNIFLHDPNLRRGGRSYLEAMIALWTGGLFEAQVEVDKSLPQGLTNEQRYSLYTHVCDDLFNSDTPIFPFSTAFGYFGADHDKGKSDFAKFKLAVPMSHPLIVGKPRSEHLSAVKGYVESLVNTHAKSR